MFLIRVIKELNKHGVDYAIVGGFAVALHGAVRGTVDLDIVIKLTKESYVAAEEALLALGLQPRLPVRGDQVFAFRREYIENRNLVAWSFYNPIRPSEVVDIVITHDLRKMRIKRLEFQGQEIRVLGIEDLIEMKKQSARPQDHEDIRALDALRKARK